METTNDVEDVQLSEITKRILKFYNQEFDTQQKENNNLCNQDENKVGNKEKQPDSQNQKNILMSYGSSILGVNNLSEQNFNEIINNKLHEFEARNKSEKIDSFKCNFEENNKRIVDKNGINSKNGINFIEDQEFMYKIIKYRRLEVIKQLIYFKKAITLFKYLCISEKNLQQKQEKLGHIINELYQISNNKNHVKDIIEFMFIGNKETGDAPAKDMLKKTLCKYLFLTSNFYKIIPKQKESQVQKDWNEEWDKLIGKEEVKK